MSIAQDVLPARFRDVAELEDFMTAPSPVLAAEFGALQGDLIILGVGGKMGPTLARMAKRAAPKKRVIGVARFSEKGLRDKLTGWGIDCIEADLLDRDVYKRQLSDRGAFSSLQLTSRAVLMHVDTRCIDISCDCSSP